MSVRFTNREPFCDRRKEEYLRLSSEERFALMNAKLEEATREVSNQAELLARLRADQDRSSHPISALLHLLGHLLGHDDPGSSQKRQAVKWFERGPFYLIFWPVSVSNLALEWVATKTEGENMGLCYGCFHCRQSADLTARRSRSGRENDESFLNTLTVALSIAVD